MSKRPHLRKTGETVVKIASPKTIKQSKSKPRKKQVVYNEIEESNNTVNNAIKLYLDSKYEESIPLFLDAAAILEGLIEQYPEDKKVNLWTTRKREYIEHARLLNHLLDEQALTPDDEPIIITKDTLEYRPLTKIQQDQHAISVAADIEEDSEYRRHLTSASELVVSQKELKNIKTMKNIAGLDSVKTFVDQNIMFPQERPDLFTGKRKIQKNTMLFGPPGNGKTAIAMAIAKDQNIRFMKVRPADIKSKYLGQSENKLKAIFDVAKANQPMLIFFDEVDSLTTKRTGEGSSEAGLSIKAQFLSELSELEGDPTITVYIMTATNIPESVDTAFKRRFRNQIYVGLPNEEARKQLIKDGITDPKIQFANDLNIDQLAKETDGFSGADISDSIVPNALNMPIHEIRQSKNRKHMKPRKVTMTDFRKAITQTTKTSTKEDILRYKTYQAKLGSQYTTNQEKKEIPVNKTL